MPEPKFFDEDTLAPTHGAAPGALTPAAATYAQATAETWVSAINDMIAALKSAGILAQD